MKLDEASYLRSLREKAKAAGLCYQCRARPAVVGVSQCHVCRDRQRKVKVALAEQDRCKCGRPRVEGFASCRPCLDYSKAKSKQDRVKRRESGICTHPGCKWPPMSDGSLCAMHRRYAADKSRDNYAKRARRSA